jgi:hypothetical protein
MSSGRVKVFRESGKGQSSKFERIKTHTHHWTELIFYLLLLLLL